MALAASWLLEVVAWGRGLAADRSWRQAGAEQTSARFIGQPIEQTSNLIFSQGRESTGLATRARANASICDGSGARPIGF